MIAQFDISEVPIVGAFIVVRRVSGDRRHLRLNRQRFADGKIESFDAINLAARRTVVGIIWIRRTRGSFQCAERIVVEIPAIAQILVVLEPRDHVVPVHRIHQIDRKLSHLACLRLRVDGESRVGSHCHIHAVVAVTEQIHQDIDVTRHLLTIAARPVFLPGGRRGRVGRHTGDRVDRRHTRILVMRRQAAMIQVVDAGSRQQIIDAQLALNPLLVLSAVSFDLQQCAQALAERVFAEGNRGRSADGRSKLRRKLVGVGGRVQTVLPSAAR